MIHFCSFLLLRRNSNKGFAADRRWISIPAMSEIHLSPSQNEPEFGDERLVGEWAGFLPVMLATPQQPPWCSYAVSRGDRIVGLGGFKGAPDEHGVAELSYLTFEPERGRRVATVICSALIEIARTAKASAIIAHTLPEENASTAVLRANHFTFTGPVTDPEDGSVWAWRREL